MYTQSLMQETIYPLVTIIIPIWNCSQLIPLTLESILDQDYPHFEIIAIDGGSTDRSLELLQSYGSKKIRLSSIDGYHVYKMINAGIELSEGEYINVLFPGDFYIHLHTLRDIMDLALEQRKPHLVYCGTLLRDGKSEVKFLFRELTLDLLYKGQQPTSLQGCWWKKKLFEKIGLFRTDFSLRGGFDLLCRFALHPNLNFASMRRALTDYDLRWVTSQMVIRHFYETMITVYRYFGFYQTVKWLYRQRDISRFIKLWIRRVRAAFFGR